MIPLRDENPTQMVAITNWLLVAANVIVWFRFQGAGLSEPVLVASVQRYGVIACEVTRMCPVEGLGWGALFTSMFLHGSWGHLLGNMLFLAIFGNNVEDSMGHLRYLAFYLLCGLAAALAQVWINPASGMPMVGASGAISGVMGAYVLFYPGARVRTWIPPFFVVDLPALVVLGYWFLTQLLLGTATVGLTDGGVAYWAHIGGFVTGLALARVFGDPVLVRARRAKVRLSRAELARHRW